MNRWAYRILALLMLLGFALVFAHLHRQLVLMQRARQPAATTTRLMSTR